MSSNKKGFNLIFCSQGSALTIFDCLLPHLDKQLTLNNIGIFVADQPFFDSYTSKRGNLTRPNIQWLKEWEINRVAASKTVDNSKLRVQEDLYGTPNLWPALISDRRVFLGRDTKYKQDYAPRLSYDKMLQLLQTSTEQIEAFITALQPQAIIGFNMVTLSEYLFYLIAQQKGIPYWQIRNAKISNYITLVPDPLNTSQYLRQKNNGPLSEPVQQQARDYLASAKQKNSTYEGHVILKPPTITTILRLPVFVKLSKSAAFSLIKTVKYPHDHQSAGLRSTWQFNIAKPLRSIKHHRYLSPHYLPAAELPQTNYVFFPLHTEPEIALSIYGRYHQNQIEVIRNIAQSIPVSWQVIVKDHPRSLGLRKLQYYKKLLQIPNVKLVNPYLNSYDVISNAQAIVTISSWVGFEAVMSKKPVVTMGECNYNALPDSMVVKNSSYSELATDILNAISKYNYDEEALIKHISTVISLSYPINMYSDVLAKADRHTVQVSDRSQVWQNFAAYIAATIKKPNI